MSRPRFGLFKCTLCYIWRELKDKRERREQNADMQSFDGDLRLHGNRRQTRGGWGGGGSYSTIVTQPPPAASLLLFPWINTLRLDTKTCQMTTCSCCFPQHRDACRLISAVGDRKLFFYVKVPSNCLTMWRICRMFHTAVHSEGRMLIPLVLLQQHNNNFRNCYGNPRRGGISAATWSWNAMWDSKSTKSEIENSKIVSGSKKWGCLRTKAGEHQI